MDDLLLTCCIILALCFCFHHLFFKEDPLPERKAQEQQQGKEQPQQKQSEAKNQKAKKGEPQQLQPQGQPPPPAGQAQGPKGKVGGKPKAKPKPKPKAAKKDVKAAGQEEEQEEFQKVVSKRVKQEEKRQAQAPKPKAKPQATDRVKLNQTQQLYLQRNSTGENLAPRKVTTKQFKKMLGATFRHILNDPGQLVPEAEVEFTIRGRPNFPFHSLDELLKGGEKGTYPYISRLLQFYVTHVDLVLKGGLQITVMGKSFTNESVADELWMQSSWYKGLAKVLNGEQEATANPFWGEVEGEGTVKLSVGETEQGGMVVPVLEMEHVTAAKRVTLRTTRILLQPFVETLLTQGNQFREFLREMAAEAEVGEQALAKRIQKAKGTAKTEAEFELRRLKEVIQCLPNGFVAQLEALEEAWAQWQQGEEEA